MLEVVATGSEKKKFFGEMFLDILIQKKVFFFNVYLLLRDRDWQSASRGGAEREREGDTESDADSRLWGVSTEPDEGLKLTNCEIVTWAEVGHPSGPGHFNFKKESTKELTFKVKCVTFGDWEHSKQ